MALLVNAPGLVTPTILQNRVGTNIPFTVAGASGQSVDIQDWQDFLGNTLASIDKIGRLGFPTVEAVTPTAGANAGTSPPAPVVGTSNDMRGTITFGTGTLPAAGAQVVVTFTTAFSTPPIIMLTPRNTATQALGLYVSAVTTTSFTVSCTTAPAASQGNTIYSFSYVAID